MQSVVDGTLTGEPAPHLIFTNVLLGLALERLYSAAAGFPWYGTYLYLLHYAALAALVYIVMSGPRPRLGLRLVLLSGVLSVFHLPMWLGLQFTSTAMVLTASGVALAWVAVNRAAASWPALATAGTILGLAWWVRWRASMGVILLGLPILAPALRRANWRRFAVLAGATALVIAVGSVAEAAYYSGRPDWREWSAFNAVRAQLHEARTRTLLTVDPAVLAQVGWSDNDLRMFQLWFYTDPTVHEAADLETIAAALGSEFRSGEALHLLGESARGAVGWMRPMVAVSVGALAWLNGDRRRRATIALAAVATVGAAFLAAATMKLPERVAVPLLALLPITFLSLLSAPEAHQPEDADHTRGPRLRALLLATALTASIAAVVVGGRDAATASSQHAANETQVSERLAALEAVDPGGVFVNWAGVFPRWPDPLSVWGSDRGPRFVALGWMQRSPLALAVLDRYGLGDLYAAIAEGNGVYLILPVPAASAALADAPDLLATYLQEHYGFAGGILLPAAQLPPYTVYSGVAAFAVDRRRGLVIEARLDGITTTYPLGGAIPASRAIGSVDPSGRLLIEGRADADLVLAFSEDGAIAAARPVPASEGLPRYRLRPDVPPEGLRLYALAGGVARRIRLMVRS